MRAGRWLAVAGLVGAVLPGWAANHAPQCPSSIGLESVHLSTLPAGWHQEPVDHLNLDGFEFYIGPPADHVELIGNRPSESPERRIEHWPFDPLQAIWVTCVYGEGAVVLSHPLPEGVDWCKASFPGVQAPIGEEIGLTCHVR